jgi:hypothetical protein
MLGELSLMLHAVLSIVVCEREVAHQLFANLTTSTGGKIMPKGLEHELCRYHLEDRIAVPLQSLIIRTLESRVPENFFPKLCADRRQRW